MLFALLAALVAVNIAYLVLLDRNANRRTLELAAERDERAVLLQRIQAPDAAVVEHAQQRAHPDENPYPLTDEESAEAQEERARFIREIERMENEGILS